MAATKRTLRVPLIALVIKEASPYPDGGHFLLRALELAHSETNVFTREKRKIGTRCLQCPAGREREPGQSLEKQKLYTGKINRSARKKKGTQVGNVAPSARELLP
jgi:hypothetical protein